MKKLVVLTSILSLAACADYHNSKIGMDLNQTVSTNVEAKVNVGDKVNGIAECKHVLFFTFGAPEKQTYISDMNNKFGNIINNECAAGAVYDAMSKTNADVLVSPQFTTARNGILCVAKDRCLYGTTKTIVSGWTGKISYIK